VAQPNYLLIVVSVLLMVLAVMMVKEALLALKKESPGEVLSTM
jgi:hypothetical protein